MSTFSFTFNHFNDLTIAVQEKLTAMLSGVTAVQVNTYEQHTPSSNTTGALVIHHPAVQYLMNMGCSWSAAYSIVMSRVLDSHG